MTWIGADGLDSSGRYARARAQVGGYLGAGKDALVRAARWKRVEVDVLRMLSCGLAVALPIAVGVLTDRVAEGTIAAIGALMVSSSGRVGTARERSAELLISAAVGILGIWFGAGLDERTVAGSAALVVGAVVVAALGSVRPGGDKASMQLIVTTIIGTTLVPTGLSQNVIAASFAVGAVVGTVLTLLMYAIGRLILRGPAPGPAPRRSWSADLSAWRRQMAGRAGWHFPLRLGSCLLVAEVLAHLIPTPHSSWIPLTVVIVVQRDPRNALARTVERGLGTALGVTLGAVMLLTMPLWLTVVVIGLIGSVRGHLKAANYTAYAFVMTPLLVVLTGLGHQISGALIVERVVDTALGCVISLVVGHAIWRRIDWTERPSDTAA